MTPTPFSERKAFRELIRAFIRELMRQVQELREMKTRTQIQNIEKAMDTNSIIHGIQNLLPRRRSNMSDILDKIRDSLIEARRRGVSYTALAEFLSSQNIPVTDFTLRRYLSAYVGKTRPTRCSKKDRSTLPKEDVTQTKVQTYQGKESISQSASEPAWKKPLSEADQSQRRLPPRLRNRNH
jgi:hypothetical protein